MSALVAYLEKNKLLLILSSSIPLSSCDNLYNEESISFP